MEIKTKDIIKALLTHKETLPNLCDYDGKSKTKITLGSFSLKFKANKSACESVIAKYEKNYTHPNFQGKLEWARRDTRNFKQKVLSAAQLLDFNYSLI